MSRLTPLTPYTLPRKFALQSLSLPYNVMTCGLYYVSANGFPKHLIDAKDLPHYILALKDQFNMPIQDLKYAWQYWALGTIVAGTSLMLISHLCLMHIRVAKLFGYHVPKDPEQPNCFISLYTHLINVLSFLAGIVKALIAGSSFLALGASIAGFYPALGVTGAFLIGNVLTQISNFSEVQEKQSLCCCQLGTWIKSGIAGYSGFSKAVFDMALYFNTVNQFPMRQGLIDKPLSGLDPHTWQFWTYMATHVALFSLPFGLATATAYYARVRKNLSTVPVVKYSLLGTDHNVSDSENESDDAEKMPNSPYRWTDRVNPIGIDTALYKSAANVCATLNILHTLIKFNLKEITPITVSMFIGAAIFWLLNIPLQLTYYSKTNDQLSEKGVIPSSNFIGKVCKLFACSSTTTDTAASPTFVDNYDDVDTAESQRSHGRYPKAITSGDLPPTGPTSPSGKRRTNTGRSAVVANAPTF